MTNSCSGIQAILSRVYYCHFGSRSGGALLVELSSWTCGWPLGWTWGVASRAARCIIQAGKNSSRLVAHFIQYRRLYHRIDRGRASALVEASSARHTIIGSHQKHIDSLEVMRHDSPPLAEGSDEYEPLWILTRLSTMSPTPFSLRVSDICLFIKWITHTTPSYDLLRRNCFALGM
jgi:hypothetical protein